MLDVIFAGSKFTAEKRKLTHKRFFGFFLKVKQLIFASEICQL